VTAGPSPALCAEAARLIAPALLAWREAKAAGPGAPAAVPGPVTNASARTPDAEVA